MPFPFPQPLWPAELEAAGPPEDPTIVLSGAAWIGDAPHRVLAVRINSNTLTLDYHAGLDEEVYAGHQLEEMLEEMTFLDDISRSVLAPIGGANYVVWMMPFSSASQD